MRRNLQFGIHRLVAAVALASIALATGCTPYAQSDGGGTPITLSCDSLLAEVVANDRTGDTSHAINGQMDNLSRNCPTQYEIVTDYFTMVIAAAKTGTEKCKAWTTRGVRQEAIDLLEEDGLCTRGKSKAATKAAKQKSWTDGATNWKKARNHVGERKRVCGPVKSSRITEFGTFINIGRDYPNTKRFTLVLWNTRWLAAPEAGTVVCATGQISSYEGVAQMELDSADAVEFAP